MKILFLCTSNVNRSRTAEEYFRSECPENEYRSAGLSEKYCKKYNSTLCTEQLLLWADKVYVMEQAHIDRVVSYVGNKYSKKMISLEIEDIYQFMDQSLINELKSKAKIA